MCETIVVRMYIVLKKMMISTIALYTRWFDTPMALISICFPLVMEKIGISTLRNEKVIQSPMSIVVM